MPYKIQDNCVYRTDDTGTLGKQMTCAATPSEAHAHVKALAYAEAQGIDVDALDTKELAVKCGEWATMGEYVPWTAKSFTDLDATRQAQDTDKSLRKLTNDFSSLVSNILSDPEVETAPAIKALADEYSTRVEQVKQGKLDEEKIEAGKKKEGWFEGVVARLKEVFPKLANFATEAETGTKEAPHTGLMVWKEADAAGEEAYKWLARYSNNLRDNDFPPEIISAESHQRFVDMVENKEAPLPELWLWHRPEWKVGQADWVTWDQDASGIGFAMAGGHFDKEAEWVAEAMATLPEIGVSHGMPKVTITRSETDPTVITTHLTKEISPLPTWAAANQWADFVALTQDKEQDMIPQHKKEELVEQWKLDPTKLAALEALNTRTAAQAKEAQVEHKEKTDSAEPAETPVPEAEAAPDATQAVLSEIAEAIKEVLAPLQTALTEQAAQISALQTQVKELTRTDEEKIADKAAGVPQASLSSMLVQRIIGNDATRVDGRTSFAKQKPTVPAVQKEADGNILSGVVSSIIAEHTHAAN